MLFEAFGVDLLLYKFAFVFLNNPFNHFLLFLMLLRNCHRYFYFYVIIFLGNHKIKYKEIAGLFGSLNLKAVISPPNSSIILLELIYFRLVGRSIMTLTTS